MTTSVYNVRIDGKGRVGRKRRIMWDHGVPPGELRPEVSPR